MTIEPKDGWSQRLVQFLNLISFSVLYVFCCLPVISVGGATVSMSVTMRHLRKGESITYSDFFRNFKRYFRQGTILWLITALCVGATIICFSYYRQFQPISWPLYLAGVGMGTLCLLVIPWLFGCAGYFETDSFHMLVFAYYLSIKHLGYTFLLMLTVYGLLYVGVLTLVALPVIPGLILYLEAGTFQRIFQQYDKQTLQLLPKE